MIGQRDGSGTDPVDAALAQQVQAIVAGLERLDRPARGRAHQDDRIVAASTGDRHDIDPFFAADPLEPDPDVTRGAILGERDAETEHVGIARPDTWVRADAVGSGGGGDPRCREPGVDA